MHLSTSYLYARPSFVEGVSRLIDFGNTLQQYNISLNHNQADALALYFDWLAIGNDLTNAMNQYGGIEFEVGDELIQQACKALKLE